MKNVACLVLTLLAGGAFFAVVRADDPSSQVLSTTDKLSAQDADGTPLIITHPETAGPSEAEIAAQKKNDRQQAANSDWLLRSYEQQLHNRSAKVPGSQADNLYYRIATDKNLSKLAGINQIDDSSLSLKTGSSGQRALTLRPDAVPVAAPTTTFQPLITPMGAADAAGLHNFYSSLPVATPSAKSKRIDPVDMEMPGKLAADSNPITKDKLTFDSGDSLPDETTHSSHLDSASKALPLTTNIAQVQKQTSAALLVPGTAKTTTSPNVSTLQLKLAAEPPAPKLVAPGTGRMPIANPYSILDR